MRENQASEGTIGLCQKILRINTGIILSSLVLIIGITTISTDSWARLIGKSLYYVIVLDTLFYLGVWYYRTRVEKALYVIDGEEGN